MKKLIFLLSCTVILLNVKAQSSSEIETIGKFIQKTAAQSSNKELILSIWEQFKSGSKVSAEDLMLDYVGLSVQPGSDDILPAKYSLSLQDLSSIGSPGKITHKNGEDKYIHAFRSDPAKLASNLYFNSLKYESYGTPAKLSPNENGLQLRVEKVTTFFRKKGDWIYAISTDPSFKKIVLYEFYTRAISSDDYFMIRLEKERRQKL